MKAVGDVTKAIQMKRGFPSRERIADTPLAQNLYRLMTERGFSNMKSLSLRAGMGASFVADIFAGNSRQPRREGLQKLAAIMGVSIDDLTGIESGPTSINARLMMIAVKVAEQVLAGDARRNYSEQEREERKFRFATNHIYPIFSRYEAGGGQITEAMGIELIVPLIRGYAAERMQEAADYPANRRKNP
jgi:transcriptional regulator with XRE-family HTH domain